MIFYQEHGDNDMEFRQAHGDDDYGLNKELNPYCPVFLSPIQAMAG